MYPSYKSGCTKAHLLVLAVVTNDTMQKCKMYSLIIIIIGIKRASETEEISVNK